MEYHQQHGEGIRQPRFINLVSTFALAVAVVTAVFTYNAVVLTNHAVQLATQPQVSFYLQPVDANTGAYIFGIENNGTTIINNVSTEVRKADIYKNGCLTDSTKITCGGSGVSGWDGFPNPIKSIPPLESRTFEISIATSSSADFIHSLSVIVRYEREIDKQEYTIPVTYFIDGVSVYTLDTLRDIPRMQFYIASFREFSAQTTLGGQKIYWK